MADRQKELAAIHIAKKQLAMNDDDYREMLFRVARVRTAADLDVTGRHKVLDHLRYLGFKNKKKDARMIPTMKNEGHPVARKIYAMLSEMKRPAGYADSICKQMFGIDRLEWCTTRQLQAVMVAVRAQGEKEGADVF